MRNHTGERPFPCLECKRLKSDLKAHMKTHRTGKSFKCTPCNKSYKHQASLDQHRLLHDGGKKQTCSSCNMRFTRKSVCKRHKRIDTGESFLCPECNCAFQTQCTLREYMKLHGKEKLFKCNKCDKTFRQSSCLSLHKKRHDDGCTYCARRFLRRDQKKHEQRHSRPHYPCEKCFSSNTPPPFDEHDPSSSLCLMRKKRLASSKYDYVDPDGHFSDHELPKKQVLAKVYSRLVSHEVPKKQVLAKVYSRLVKSHSQDRVISSKWVVYFFFGKIHSNTVC